MADFMYIPRRESPWERMLPQILGQMAMMKVQQNFQAKQQEMELGEKVALAGGKELTPEEVKTPKQQGYRRVKIRGKTYRVPLTAEEKLTQQGVFKVGTDLYKDLGGGQFQRITDSSEYQPKLFVDKEGEYKWIEPGKPVPKGYKRYSGTTAKGTKPPTPQAALKRISAIREKMATFDKTSLVTQALATQFPNLAPYINQKAPKAVKDKVFKAWNEELDYLYEFVPSESPGVGFSELSDEDLVNKLVSEE